MKLSRIVAIACVAAFALVSSPAAADARIDHARSLLSSARKLDASADANERRAVRLDDNAAELRDDAADLRRRSARAKARKKARMQAKADDLEVRALIADRRARAANRLADARRADADQLRAEARAVASGKKAAPAKRSAKISVNSRTPCRVSVDGVFRGMTPLMTLHLLPGRHLLSCTTLNGTTVSKSLRLRANTRRSINLAPGLKNPNFR